MGSSLAQSKPEGGVEKWEDREGCRPLQSRADALVEVERGQGRSSYLWGSKGGRRGFREDSYKALGTHKIRHFQLHRVR